MRFGLFLPSMSSDAFRQMSRYGILFSDWPLIEDNWGKLRKAKLEVTIKTIMTMAVLDLTVEQIIKLVKQLPPEGKKAVFQALTEEFTENEHPWLKLAGKYQDDPQFDEMLANIEAERRDLDAEMEDYYRQLDVRKEAS